MKAVRITQYGSTPTVEEIPSPRVGPKDVLVRIEAASLNPLDVKLQSGVMHQFFPLSFPYTLGTDFAGTVEGVGSMVARWQTGDKVVGRLDPISGGALAEFAVVPGMQLAAAPPTISIENAAGIPTAAGTAWQALFEIAKLQRGQSVLVHAGAGGVGSFAVQFARLVGARVIATASGAGIELARELGADQVIDYRAVDFTKEVSDVDLVLDTLGGDTQQRSFGVLRNGGTLISTTAPPDEAMAKAHQLSAAFVFHQSNSQRLAVLLGLFDAGMFKVTVDRHVTLMDLASAFDHQRSGRARGKIIVKLN
jgi:NADPH:quinone reductase-like Zn-dependent oxidoreductase